MKKIAFIAAAAVLAIASNAVAGGDYQAQVDRCLQQHANTHDAASVTLECDAQGGKLTNCKVLENAAGKGFDKAALCVADFLPMAGKTGAVRVPVRFSGDS